jgi:exonuclease III
VLQRLETLGLVDCQGTFSGDRSRTLRHNRIVVPWVIDYVYATKALAKKVVSHRVVEDADVIRLSDHNVVEVTFDL